MKSVMVSIPAGREKLEMRYRGRHVIHNFDRFLRLTYNEETFHLPTNLCNLLSHRGAALRPFATKAKKAFLTCKILAHCILIIIIFISQESSHCAIYLCIPARYVRNCIHSIKEAMAAREMQSSPVVWCQIWLACSLLAWHHSNSAFS